MTYLYFNTCDSYNAQCKLCSRLTIVFISYEPIKKLLSYVNFFIARAKGKAKEGYYNDFGDNIDDNNLKLYMSWHIYLHTTHLHYVRTSVMWMSSNTTLNFLNLQIAECSVITLYQVLWPVFSVHTCAVASVTTYRIKLPTTFYWTF